MSDVYQAQPVPAVPDKASGMAIAALVLGILSFCCCGLFAGIPALIVGFMENGKINRGQSSARGKWMAIVGIVMGFISLILTCVQIIWIFFLGGMSVLQQLMQHASH
jgi:thiol:disulfide interchange protein